LVMRNTKTLKFVTMVIALAVLAGSFFFPSQSVSIEASAADVLYGDVNGNGSVDSLDAAQVLKYDAMMITLDSAALTRGDVSGDGYVDSLDAARILKFDAGMIDSLDPNGSSTPVDGPINYDNMKGVWVDQFSAGSLFNNAGTQRSEESFRTLAAKMVDNLSRDGFNTVILQMRPNGDSLYPSEIYPPSPSVGVAYDGEFAYDPLEIFLEIAHAKNLSVHGWINPMRLMKTEQIVNVPTKYTLGEWYNDSEKNGTYIVAYDGYYYLNPAYPEARQLVIDGVMEMCKNYDVDGVHFDDYFYADINPESLNLAFDQKAYELYGNSAGTETNLTFRKDFRRQQVNTLVKDVYSAIHEYNDDLVFGISPAGNISTNTAGYLCADVRSWCSAPGYVDYICPQVYWSFDHPTYSSKFNNCVSAWANLCTSNSVKLYIGIPTYLASNSAPSGSDVGWKNYDDNIARMLDYVKLHNRSEGFIFFAYGNTYNLFTGGYATNYSKEIDNYIGKIKEW